MSDKQIVFPAPITATLEILIEDTSITWFTVLSDHFSRACEGFMPITTNGGDSGVQSSIRPSAKR